MQAWPLQAKPAFKGQCVMNRGAEDFLIQVLMADLSEK